jgi:hypothetical protein
MGRIVVVVVLWHKGERMVIGTVVCRGISFAEVVGFHVRCITTHEFPVHLIQIVRFENDTADDALSSGRSHYHGNGAEEDVEVRLDCWRLASGTDSEFGASSAILHRAGGCIPDLVARVLVEEVKCSIAPESRVRRASGVQWVARGPCLSRSLRQEGQSGQGDQRKP